MLTGAIAFFILGAAFGAYACMLLRRHWEEFMHDCPHCERRIPDSVTQCPHCEGPVTPRQLPAED